MNDAGIKYWNADCVGPTTITATWTINGDYDVQNGVGGDETIQTMTITDTTVFSRVGAFDSKGATQWRVTTGGNDVGEGASVPPFFRDDVAFYEIEMTGTKSYSGNSRFIPSGGAPVDTPLTGTVSLSVAFYTDSLTTGYWYFNFSPSFNLESDSDTAGARASLTKTIDPVTMKVGASADFGATWTYTTPSGSGFPGYIVHSWNVDLTITVVCS